MPATTPTGLPYPLPTDPVAHGADDIKALALAVDGRALPIVTALPTTGLFDGMTVVLTDNGATPTYFWAFRYVAGEASAFKWHFVGGAPLIGRDLAAGATLNTGTVITAGFWSRPGLYLPAPRAGDYLVEGWTNLDPNGGAGTGFLAAFAGAATINPAVAITLVATLAGQTMAYPVAGLASGAAAGANLGIALNTTNAGVHKFGTGLVKITPVRVS